MTLSPDNQRPLLGLRVVVTRPAEPRDTLAVRLRELGAEVVLQPAICIGPLDDWRPVDAALARLHEFDWLVFLSANGVRYLLDRLVAGAGLVPQPTSVDRWGRHSCLPEKSPNEADRNVCPTDQSTSQFTLVGALAQLSQIRIAAIGPGTADELARYGVRAELVPEQFRAEALAEALSREAPGHRFLLARASRGREVLAEQLVAAGATVEQVVVYTSTDVEQPDPEVVALLRAGQIDWITVTSSAIARSLAKLLGPDMRLTQLASISPITSATLRELGYEPTAEADEYTLAGLAAAIVKHYETGMQT